MTTHTKTKSEIVDWIVENHDYLRARTQWVRDQRAAIQKDELADVVRDNALNHIRSVVFNEAVKGLQADPLDVIVVVERLDLSVYL